MNNHHLISANRLDDGAVVWLDEAFEWVDTLDLACAFDHRAVYRDSLPWADNHRITYFHA